ncbi:MULTISPECIES: dermonecrotic toxin domain-containing protein [Pseudomonas]|uniref:dermonecrotic toxin domain-containing protein n=1 Tax=Pseudomonas TaxID=286 RepID=UPI00398F9308
MNIASLPGHPPAPTVTSKSPDPAPAAQTLQRSDQARRRFIDEADEAFRDDVLSVEGKKLVDAVVYPGTRGAPGAQVSTFAVDGVQANDILMIKRVPATAEGPNFLLYVPEEGQYAFYEFKDREELTDWVKTMALDPKELDSFARHFSNDRAPQQVERVRQRLVDFADNDINAVVGSFARVKGDVFTYLSGTGSVPPAPVKGLTGTRLYNLAPDGSATYIGKRTDGKEVIYKYDAYGNLHGAARDGFYFVKNALNDDQPLQLLSFDQYRQTVTSVALDNVGANDLNGLYEELLKQFRNPGHGLGKALTALGVPEDVAHSLETRLTNPGSGTLVELNRDNRIGKLFGVDQKTMDAQLENLGEQAQGEIPYYGTTRTVLTGLADGLEQIAPVRPASTTVRTG